MQDAVRWYIAINYRLLEEISGRIGNSVTGNVSRLMIAYKYILRAIEHITISVVYEVQKYHVEDLPITSLISYVKHDTLAREYIDATRYFAPELTTDFEENDPFDRLKEIYANASTISSNTNGISDYYYSAKAYVEILRKWEDTVRDIIREELYREMISATGQQGITIAILTLVLIISPIIIYLVRYATLTFQQFTDALISRTQELRREKIKSDLLLSQMLPPMVVKQLKQQRQVVAEYFDSVTICFSDIIGFTRISANSTAMEVLNMLNALYRLFDLRIKEYDVYKVETIGDSYMVVSGLPQRNGNRHADEIASMSLDLLDSIRTYDIPHRSGEKLEIRVGINTGPCVAGVIGTTMPRYCLVGDTINTASRMESTGEAMKIHISQSTNDALNLLGGYRIQLRGSMEVKGKGIMNTYWLIGKDNCTVENSNDQRLVPFPSETKLQPEFFYLIE